MRYLECLLIKNVKNTFVEFLAFFVINCFELK